MPEPAPRQVFTPSQLPDINILATPPLKPLLAFDTASPIASVALWIAGATPSALGTTLATRQIRQRESSKALLRLVDEVLQEGGVPLHEVGGLAAARGPGSFTGLRVGLATVVGLMQATGLPAAAVPTLDAIAEAAREPVTALGPASEGDTGREDMSRGNTGPGNTGPGNTVLAVLDAHRGHFFAQTFQLPDDGPPRPIAPLPEAGRVAIDTLPTERLADGTLRLVGPDADALVGTLGPALDPTPLAVAVARVATARTDLWRPDLLVQPLYLLPPPATPPRPRPAGGTGHSR